MKIEIDGKLINIIEGSNERVRDYIDFMNRLAQDPDKMNGKPRPSRGRGKSF